MRKLIFIELHMLMGKRTIFITMGLASYILLQLVALARNAIIEGLNASVIDGMLKVCGGLNSEFSILGLMEWLIVTSILLLLLQWNVRTRYGFDVMLLTRSDTRTQWWGAKVISLVITNIVFIVILMLVTGAISSLILNTGIEQLSTYSISYYSTLTVYGIKALSIVFLVLLSGFLCLSTSLQLISLLSNNNIQFYFGSLALFIILSAFHSQDMIPWYLSPLHYPSFLSISPTNGEYLNHILFSSTLTIINILASLIHVRTKDLINFEN